MSNIEIDQNGLGPKRLGGLQVTHEKLKEALGINGDVWITGIVYDPQYDKFVIHVRGPGAVSFLGETYQLPWTAEGCPNAWVNSL